MRIHAQFPFRTCGPPWRLELAIAAIAFMTAWMTPPREARAIPPGEERALADALFRDGRKLLQAGQIDQACAKFEDSYRLDPQPGTLLNLGICHEQQGKLAAAWAELTQAKTQAIRDARDDRVKIATEHLAATDQRLPRIVLETDAIEQLPGLSILLDETSIGRSALGTALPVDPGPHQLIVSAAAHRSALVSVTLVAGERRVVSLPALVPVPVARPEEEVRGGAGPDQPRPPRPAAPASHSGQTGLFARADVDPRLRGAVGSLLLTRGIGNVVEASVGAMLGRHSGAYAGATLFASEGAWKPLAIIGMPVFFIDGPRLGVHGALGLEWDPEPELGVLAAGGIEYHPKLPAGFDPLAPVVSLGVQGRL